MQRIICLLIILSLLGCATPKKVQTDKEKQTQEDIWKNFEEALERMDDGNSR